MNDLDYIKKKIKKHSETSVYNPKRKVKQTFFDKTKDKLNKVKNKFFNLFKKEK